MARRRKQKMGRIDLSGIPGTEYPIKYYWCVNCGRHGFFNVQRHRNAKCVSCGYDELTKLDKEEYYSDAEERPWILSNLTYDEWKKRTKK